MAAVMHSAQVASYAAEVTKAQHDVAVLEAVAMRDARDAEKRIRLAYRQFHLASLTNHPEHFEAVQRSVGSGLADFGPKEDLCLLQANIDGRFHRLHDVKQTLSLCPALARRASGRAIAADVDFQEGRYGDAFDALSELIAEEGAWDNLARLAHWHSKLGDRDTADALYVSAENELTAKEMRSFAWLELQRGELALSQGAVDQAGRHAALAVASFPGHWKSDEFTAKVLAARGELESSLALLKAVATSHPKPELHQAIGELLTRLGRAEEAGAWFAQALHAYLVSVERGEVHYYHHLADFYADSGGQPAEAVRFARMDVTLRANFSTHAALAWALYCNAEFTEGIEAIQRALGSGAEDASMLTTAAALYGAAGDTARESEYQTAARRINPLSHAVYLHV